MERRSQNLGRLIDAARFMKFDGHFHLSPRTHRWFHYFPFLIFSMLALPGLFVTPVPRLLGLFSFAAALFIMLLYPWKAGREKLLIAHGLVYAGCFLLLLIYALAPNGPGWMQPFLFSCSILAFIWVLIKVAISHNDPIMYPSAFEILLMLFSWFIPLVLVPTLGLSLEIQRLTIMICVQTVPLLCLTKLTVRRYPLRNRSLASGFIIFFLALGTATLL